MHAGWKVFSSFWLPVESDGWQQSNSKSILLRLPPLHSQITHGNSEVGLIPDPQTNPASPFSENYGIRLHFHHLTFIFLRYLSLSNENATGKGGTFNLNGSVSDLSSSLFSSGDSVPWAVCLTRGRESEFKGRGNGGGGHHGCEGRGGRPQEPPCML